MKNWRINPPLGVGLLCALMIAGALALSDHQPTAGRVAPVTRNVEANAIEDPPPNPNPERREWREERDLRAQQEMARWAFWMVVASTVGTLVAAVGVLFVGATLRQQGQFFVAERRPWLHLKVRAEDWVDEGEFAKVSVRLIAENVGHSPALHVYFGAELREGLYSFTDREHKTFQEQIAEHKHRWSPFGGDTIFPGKRHRKGMTIKARVRRVNDSAAGTFYLPVFISYRYVGSSKLHVTPVVQAIILYQSAPSFSDPSFDPNRIVQQVHTLSLPPD